MARPFALRLIEDLVAPGGQLLFPADGVNRIVYVVHGAIEIARKGFSDDESWHDRGAAKVEATSLPRPSGPGVPSSELLHCTMSKANTPCNVHQVRASTEGSRHKRPEQRARDPVGVRGSAIFLGSHWSIAK